SPLTNADGVAVSPGGGSVYVASEGLAGAGSATVTHFFAAPGGQLSYDGCVSNDSSAGCAVAPGSSLIGANAVAVSPDGRSIYVTAAPGYITHFFAAPGGQLTYDGCVSNDGSGGLCGDAPGTPLSGAESVAVSPDGRSVYVASATSGTITHFFAAPGGQLTYDGCISNDGSGGRCADAPGSPFTSATSVAVSPDGNSVYVASPDAGMVSTLAAAPGGQLTYSGCISADGSNGQCTDAPGTSLNGVTRVAVSPNGNSVYADSFTGSAEIGR